MLVTINDLSDPPRQVEVELPLYRTFNASNDRFEVNYFYKIEAKGERLRRLEICVDGLNGITISFSDNFSFSGVTGDFILAERGYRTSDAEEFGRAIWRAQQDLAEFTP